jgi:biopolymer transport protein ExbB/TolQ
VTQLARFRRGTATLPQLSNLATLLGLLGTIHGLIISFSGMQGVDAAARQAALSKGVAVAFYNTFFGLTVATATVIAYLFVSAKQARELTRMEATTSTIIDHILMAPEAARKAAA